MIVHSANHSREIAEKAGGGIDRYNCLVKSFFVT